MSNFTLNKSNRVVLWAEHLETSKREEGKDGGKDRKREEKRKGREIRQLHRHQTFEV
jgi:hypothetical protein